jgi:uncharacterized protein
MRVEPENPDDRIAELCRRHNVRRCWIFGSAARGELRPDSDIDVLVETDPANPPGILALGGLQMDLSDLFGRFVDLTTLASVPADLRDRLLSGAQLRYAA